MNVSDVLPAYIAAALWSSNDSEGTPLDQDHDADDLAEATRDQMRDDVQSFLDLAGTAVAALDPSQVGHDFWLTRNHHGAGFWDRGYGDLGDELTDVAQSFGDCDLYVGDDALIYI